ncbi:GPALPP motifs-containing protein 1-like isoform X4 [Rhopilema esculentum]|uniref:GPALPP motifs-containing protein 1-like isoform X4 n=1 Tax=Rhopilema esculentum TaxID=499914 RepID=UPI0031D9FEF4|eukprot:gene16640-8076_t
MADDIGPKLPPHLLNVKSQSQNSERDKNSSTLNSESDEGKEEQLFGPALPPHMLSGKKESDSDVDNIKDKLSVGPALPPGWNRTAEKSDDDEEDDDFIGPVPGEDDAYDESALKRHEIEARATAMKDKLSGKGKEAALKREQWMTELPPELGANIGIVARTFKKKTLNSTEGDRSVWTDTPADRQRKLKEKLDKKEKVTKEEAPAPIKKDLETIARIQEHNKQHRSASLMELHHEERKKKKGDGPSERRAFDRNQDLDLKRVDKKATSSFIKSSKNLNSKFENSRFDSKFL